MSVTKVNTKKHGSAQAIMYLLHYGEGKISHLKEAIEKWLRDEGAVLGQIHVVDVAKALGTVIGIVSGDQLKDDRLEAFANTIYDILKKHEAVYEEKDAVKRKAMIEEFEKETLHVHLLNFENVLIHNLGFFIGRLTWVDIFFAGAIEVMEYYMGDKIIEGKYPYLFKLVTDISELPQIKKYNDDQKKKPQ